MLHGSMTAAGVFLGWVGVLIWEDFFAGVDEVVEFFVAVGLDKAGVDLLADFFEGFGLWGFAAKDGADVKAKLSAEDGSDFAFVDSEGDGFNLLQELAAFEPAESYGGSYTSIKEWENSALAGFGAAYTIEVPILGSMSQFTHTWIERRPDPNAQLTTKSGVTYP
jgi:hypothetical protein